MQPGFYVPWKLVLMCKHLPPIQSQYFFERFPWNNRWILFGLALAISCFDFLAGKILMFPVLFIVPVGLMAWNCGLGTALKLGFVLCAIRFCIQHFAWGVPYTLPVAMVNACIRLGMLFFITFLLARLSAMTRALRERVRTLEGILPTCAFCKNIRDDAGEWHEIEEYVTSHSQAKFSHGVCPKCAEQHYGDCLDASKAVATER